MIVAILRVRHVERRKNTFGGEFAQCFAAYAFHNGGEKEKASIAIKPIAAGREVQRLLPTYESQRVFVCGHAINVNARQLHEREVIAQAAGVIQEVKNRDFLAVVGELRKIFPDVVAYGELPLLLQEQDARGGKLFGSRADVENRARRDC